MLELLQIHKKRRKFDDGEGIFEHSNKRDRLSRIALVAYAKIAKDVIYCIYLSIYLLYLY